MNSIINCYSFRSVSPHDLMIRADVSSPGNGSSRSDSTLGYGNNYSSIPSQGAYTVSINYPRTD